jgi:DNA-binding MarR family transcriptional regulator
MAAVHAQKCPCRLAAHANLEAYAEWRRLDALATPLREWLLRWEFDRAIIHTRPATPRKIAKRAHRREAEVRAALDQLAAEGLVRRVGNGYVGAAEARWS